MDIHFVIVQNYKTKKGQLPFLQIVILFYCGVGENRTLVQISNSKAFYILSFCLIFVALLTKNRPQHA